MNRRLIVVENNGEKRVEWEFFKEIEGEDGLLAVINVLPLTIPRYSFRVAFRRGDKTIHFIPLFVKNGKIRSRSDDVARLCDKVEIIIEEQVKEDFRKRGEDQELAD